MALYTFNMFDVTPSRVQFFLRGWMIFATSGGQRSCNSKIQAVYCMTLEHHPTKSTSRIVYYLPPLLALLSKCCQTGH